MTRIPVGPCLAVVLAGCSSNPGEPAKLWATRDFVAAAPAKKDFGGWGADLLVTPEGGELPFRRAPFLAPGASADVQPSGWGLTVFPAFAEGSVAAFTITEIWYAHPDPWVQPVWVVWNAERTRPKDAAGRPRIPNVFAVNVGSTFYSPFWRAEWFVPDDVDAVTNTTFTSAKAVLDSGKPLEQGFVILCPIVPPDVNVAGGATPVHPFTRQPLKTWAPLDGWVDGRAVKYLDFGGGRVAERDQLPEESSLYVFVKRAGGEPLPLPAVLPDDPAHHSYLRRVDVVVPATAQVFVPATWSALRDHVKGLGLNAQPPSDQIADDVARAYTLRVASDAACFVDPATFPSGCKWLDSEAAIGALGPAAVYPHDKVTLSVAALLAGGKAL